MEKRRVFVTGGTGYIGSRLIPLLLERGHSVKAVVREGSERKLPMGCDVVTGDPLKRETFVESIRPADTFVQLVGVPKPSPAKAEQFRQIDLVSIRESVAAAADAGISHFVYVSVAHPAPIMKEYIEVRAEGERLIVEAGLNSTILRPWYVLGPGHLWPYFLVPIYGILNIIPSTRESAQRLGLVKLQSMLSALAYAVESPVIGNRILSVSDIKSAKMQNSVEAA